MAKLEPGRPAPFERPISSHLKLLAEISNHVQNNSFLFDPPADIVSVRNFQNWRQNSKRSPSIKLLGDYCRWLDVHFTPPPPKKWMDFFRTPDPKRHIEHFYDIRSLRDRGAPVSLTENEDSHNRGKSLEGCYQIIRPYTKQSNRYVLEVADICQ